MGKETRELERGGPLLTGERNATAVPILLALRSHRVAPQVHVETVPPPPPCYGTMAEKPKSRESSTCCARQLKGQLPWFLERSKQSHIRHALVMPGWVGAHTTSSRNCSVPGEDNPCRLSHLTSRFIDTQGPMVDGLFQCQSENDVTHFSHK